MPTPQTCRKCGYDVSHRAVDTQRCSECGADLTIAGAILTSRRPRRWWVLIPMPIVAFSIAILVAKESYRFAWFDWYLAHAPLSWIEHMARTHHDASGDRYLDAWNERNATPAFFDYLLEEQLDPESSGRWELWFNGYPIHPAPSEAQLDRYWKQLLTSPPTFRVRSPVRMGDPVRFEIHWPRRSFARA